MAKVIGKVGLTGRYVYCPNSGSGHSLFAKQVMRSEKGILWFRCVCNFRGYFAKGSPLPLMTRESAIASGASIPDEMPPAPEAQPVPPLMQDRRRGP